MGKVVMSHRLRLLTQIIRLLMTMIPEQRGHILREQGISYQDGVRYDTQADIVVNREMLDDLLQNVPLP